MGRRRLSEPFFSNCDNVNASAPVLRRLQRLRGPIYIRSMRPHIVQEVLHREIAHASFMGRIRRGSRFLLPRRRPATRAPVPTLRILQLPCLRRRPLSHQRSSAVRSQGPARHPTVGVWFQSTLHLLRRHRLRERLSGRAARSKVRSPMRNLSSRKERPRR